MGFEEFVRNQSVLMLSRAVHPEHRATYADLFDTPA